MKRRISRGERTRQALLGAVEAVIGKYGIEGATVRQIMQAAGSGNSSVVAYHFGSLDALVKEALRLRYKEFEVRRAEIFADYLSDGHELTLVELLRVLWLPLFEQVDENGTHPCAGFILQFMRNGLELSRDIVTDEYNVTRSVVRMIYKVLPKEAMESIELRWPVSNLIVLNTIQLGDRMNLTDPAEAHQNFELGLSMAAAAMAALPGRSHSSATRSSASFGSQ